MADFCKQCSVMLFGEDFHDLADLCPEGMFATVICEGCGVIQVDHTGACVSKDCLEGGHTHA